MGAVAGSAATWGQGLGGGAGAAEQSLPETGRGLVAPQMVFMVAINGVLGSQKSQRSQPGKSSHRVS